LVIWRFGDPAGKHSGDGCAQQCSESKSQPRQVSVETGGFGKHVGCIQGGGHHYSLQRDAPARTDAETGCRAQVNAQAANAHRQRCAPRVKGPRRVLMAEPRKELAQHERDQGIIAQEKRGDGGQRQQKR